MALFKKKEAPKAKEQSKPVEQLTEATQTTQPAASTTSANNVNATANQATTAPQQENAALASIAASQTQYNAQNQTANVALPNESSVEAERRDKIARPMIGYRYKIINTQGKKEEGTFDAESENDVRNFLLSQDL